ncbi:MAG: prepilin-type N-terminal cleavage/methylation domain-containing protein [Phycisphaerales bacterium]|nr:prepilin-type N-terminal cleavage/methylation domain-containing protein [Phycisphaerales bacterium]
MSDKSTINRLTRRGFTLVEVLIAVFILGIGLIMVIAVFPVGGEWTRQATESTVSQNVAQNALAILQAHCPPTSRAVHEATQAWVTNTPPVPYPLVPFPGLAGSPIKGVPLPPLQGGVRYVISQDDGATVIPVSEMCYRFGVDSPSPADPLRSLYFWTALVRKVPNQQAGSTTNYDVYILVFKKGSLDQTYPVNAAGHGIVTVNGTDYSEFWDNNPPLGNPGRSIARDSVNYPGQPTIAKIPYINPQATIMDPNTGKIVIAPANSPKALRPTIDEYGIGFTSGTVFRQGTFVRDNGDIVATPRPLLRGQTKPDDNVHVDEHVIVGLPATGTSVSPLVYVYQTTLSWKTQ